MSLTCYVCETPIDSDAHWVHEENCDRYINACTCDAHAHADCCTDNTCVGLAARIRKAHNQQQAAL